MMTNAPTIRAAEPGRGRPAPLALADTPRRVLVVDDKRDARETLSELLTIAGHEVAIADNGVDALATFDRFRPTIVVLDLGMPAMEGYELAGCIRTCTGGESARLAALTGYGQASDRAHMRAACFDEPLV